MARAQRSTHSLPHRAVVERAELRRSGAAGVHIDQTVQRRHGAGVGRTHRVGARSAARRAAISGDQA